MLLFVKEKTQNTKYNPQASSPVQRRVLVMVLCALFIPYAFGQLDQAFVMPERLKKLVSLFGIEPTITEGLWRVRLGVAHQGVEAHDVVLTLIWLDELDKEIGRNERQLTLGPGDTSYVSLSYINKSQDRQTATYTLDHQVTTNRN